MPSAPGVPLTSETLAAREWAEVATSAQARARGHLAAPPSSLDFELLLEVEALVCFYEYNDILIRAEGLHLDPRVLNGGRTYLQVDDFPKVGRGLSALPRLFLYDQSDYYYMLHLGDELATEASERGDVNTSALYRVPPGEARRKLTLLRRRWPHEQQQTHESSRALVISQSCAMADPQMPLNRAGPDSARALCGSGAYSGGTSVGTSLPPPISQRSISSAGDHAAGEHTEMAARRERTARALRVAAAVREDAGKCWPGGVPLAGLRPDAGAVPGRRREDWAATDPVEADEGLRALLGFPTEATDLEA